MDAVVFLLIAVIMAWRVLENPEPVETKTKQNIVPEDTETRQAKLNESFYDDPEAFMEIAHALGFPRGFK